MCNNVVFVHKNVPDMLRTEKQEVKLQHDVRNVIKAYCFEGEWDYTVVLQNNQGKPLVETQT